MAGSDGSERSVAAKTTREPLKERATMTEQ
jgi:hypothetical protein